MSDSDTGDDGGFDKEAERKKLREKYERDEQDRKATQRMSDLLLKGATMTNSHCGTCGDPFFQQNGTTFCPTCHGSPGAVEGTGPSNGGAGMESGGADATGVDAGGATGTANPASDASATGTSASTDDVPATDAAASNDDVPAPDVDPDAVSTDASADAADAGSGDVERTPSNGGREPDAPSSVADRQPPRTRGADPSGSGSHHSAPSSHPIDGDLDAARASLTQALERFAREAADTDDPRYAKECLDAAREAGEALSTLR